jgi:hypothetical protein
VAYIDIRTLRHPTQAPLQLQSWLVAADTQVVPLPFANRSGRARSNRWASGNRYLTSWLHDDGL